MNYSHFALFFGLSLLAAAPAAAGSVSIGDYAGSRVTLLAIDNQSVPLRKNLCYFISQPKVRTKPVLTPSRDDPRAPDNVGAMFYGTVLHDGGKFRMWYYASGWKAALGPNATQDDWDRNIKEGPICYAESPDGLHWAKPHLGQVEYHGSRDNNAIALPDDTTEGAFVIKDESDPDPARRYKMVYENHVPGVRFYSVRTATSADGIVWKAGPQSPIDEGAEPCSFWTYDGLYIVGAHFAPRGVSEGGHKAGRQGFVWVSPDFNTWLPQSADSFLLPEPQDPNGRGLDRPYVQVHLGVAGFNCGNVLVGIYCQWQARPNAGDWFGAGTTYGDFGLLVSNDGLHFREPVPGHIFLDHRQSLPSLSPDIRYSNILTQSGNGILNVGDETWIYHGRWANTALYKDYYGEIALATLPRDRWGALGLYPRSDEGSVWTAPLELSQPGVRLTLNAEGAPGIRVEVADARFHLLPEFSGDRAGTCSTSGLDAPVAWPSASLDSLAGRRFRLLIHLRKNGPDSPRLFAAYLSGPK